MIEPHFPRKRRIVVLIIEQIAVKDLNCKKRVDESILVPPVFSWHFFFRGGGGRERK